ncbi:hypothetical protein NKDENANG_03902 [Candidatus Entotheonellaceae bacterium PAL068K]
MARQAGFEPVIEDRNVANKEKKIDTGIVAAMMKDAYTLVSREEDTLILVAGDGDYVPAVKTLVVDDGYRVDVVFWKHAVSTELMRVCSKFIALDKYIDILSA